MNKAYGIGLINLSEDKVQKKYHDTRKHDTFIQSLLGESTNRAESFESR